MMLPVVLVFIQFCIIKGKYEMVAINLPCTPKKYYHLHSKYSMNRSHFINIRCDQQGGHYLGTTYSNVWSIIKVSPGHYPHTPKGHVTISFVPSFIFFKFNLLDLVPNDYSRKYIKNYLHCWLPLLLLL